MHLNLLEFNMLHPPEIFRMYQNFLLLPSVALLRA